MNPMAINEHFAIRNTQIMKTEMQESDTQEHAIEKRMLHYTPNIQILIQCDGVTQ